MQRARGFTLVELVVVIALGAIMATTLVVFFRPALEAYLATRSRAHLADQADTALRRMVREVRSAVPNSIRTPSSQCFEFVPTTMGGRLRRAADTVNDAGPGCSPAADCSAPLDPSRATTTVDVLSASPTTPAVGDYLVVGNQNAGDVHAGTNRAAISAVSTPRGTDGRLRLSMAATQFPLGYDGARFVVVPASQQAVFYVCSGADGTLDANGHGKGTLARVSGYGFNAAHPTACPSVAGADVVATRVRSCQFVHDPNHGATLQNGFVWLQLELAEHGESTHLAVGAHVSNVP
jgi:MSHA biogenesis protein MshO